MGHMILFKNSLTFKSKIKQKLLPVSHLERYAYCFWIRCKHDSKSKETTETNKHTKWPADPKAHIHKIRTTFDNLTCKVVFKWHMKILLIKKFKSFKSHIEIPSYKRWRKFGFLIERCRFAVHFWTFIFATTYFVRSPYGKWSGNLPEKGHIIWFSFCDMLYR